MLSAQVGLMSRAKHGQKPSLEASQATSQVAIMEDKKVERNVQHGMDLAGLVW